MRAASISTSTSTSTGKRALSLALLAVQLVVFSLGAALAGTSAHARTAGHRAIVTASPGSSGDGSVVASSSHARLEQAARARGASGARGHASGLPLAELALLPGVVSIAPAALTGSLDWAAAERDHRLLPSVVNGARGPPRA